MSSAMRVDVPCGGAPCASNKESRSSIRFLLGGRAAELNIFMNMMRRYEVGEAAYVILVRYLEIAEGSRYASSAIPAPFSSSIHTTLRKIASRMTSYVSSSVNPASQMRVAISTWPRSGNCVFVRGPTIKRWMILLALTTISSCSVARHSNR